MSVRAKAEQASSHDIRAPSMPQGPISIVIPAFNEQDSIEAVLRELKALDRVIEIVVVDDGSEDGTLAAVQRFPNVVLIRHGENKGYGAALKSGIRGATGHLIITVDADGQHIASEALRLIPAIGHADLVVGVRPLERSLFFRAVGRSILRRIAIFLTGHDIPDLNSGLRIYRRDAILPLLELSPNGMSFSDSVLMTALASGLRVRFEGVEVRSRAAGSSTVGFLTAGETLLTIVKASVVINPFRVFGLLSLWSVIAGCVWAVPFFIMGGGLSVVASTLILLGVLFFSLGLISHQILSLFRLHVHLVQKIYSDSAG